MERERITISIKKKVLDQIDKIIDGSSIRNRSHAIELLSLKGLGSSRKKNAVILLGGNEALKGINPAIKFIKMLKESGYEKIYVAVGFLKDKVFDRLGSGKEYGVELIYWDKGEGTGGSLKSLKKDLDETFVVLNTTEEIDIDLPKLIEFHKTHNSTATAATKDLGKMSGVYVFEPTIINSIPAGFSMLEEDIFPKIIKDGKLVVYPIN